MVNRLKVLLSILVLAGIGGVIRTAIILQWPQLGLVLVNYTAVFGLVYGTSRGSLGRLPEWLSLGISVGFFGGLSTIAPILLDLVLALRAGAWLPAMGVIFVHIVGGILVAFFAHSRAIKGKKEVPE